MDSSDDIHGSSIAGVAPAVMSSAPSTIPEPRASTSATSTAPSALSRSVSQHSATSTRSHRSVRGHGRGSSRRGSSHAPLPGTASSSVTSEDSKSLTSFPSFSPKAKSSPSPTRSSSRTRTNGPAAASASLIQSLLTSQQQQQEQPQQPTPSSHLPVAGSAASTTASISSVPALSAARSALFEDAPLLPNSKFVPGALHLADDAHIARLIGENGAVSLVRQLAEDLAKRDAQMEIIRQRADDRERLLRKIILECGLTNLDLETRLRTLEQEEEARRAARREAEAAAAASDPDTTTNVLEASRRRVSDLVSDALADDNSIHQDSGDYYYNSGTIRANSGKTADASASDGASGTTKGWKDFLWGGGTTKKNSGSSSTSAAAATPRTVKRIPLRSGSGDRRLPVTEELFQPPLPIDPQPDDVDAKSGVSSTRAAAESTSAPAAASETGTAGEAKSGSASGRKGSLATQALRLFVSGSANSNGSGNNESAPLPGTSGPSSGTAKARTEGRNSTASSTASVRTASSANSRTPISAAVARASRASISQAGAPRTSLMSMRRTASMALLNGGTAPMSIPAGGGASHNHASNPRSQAQERWGEMLDSSPAGDAYVRRQYVPVEMDTILPLDLQPPTLTRMYNRYNSSGHLIDRFGFIYDQRRKKRQREAAQMARQVKQGSGRRSRVMSISHNRRMNRSAPELFLGDVDEDDAGTLGDAQDNNGDAADGPDGKSIGSGSGSNGASRNNSRPSSLAESNGHSANATLDDAKEGTPKRWQDYLKIATFPTELLAHTPAMSDAQIEVIADEVSPKSPGLMTPNRRGFAPPLSGPITAATTSASTTTATGTTGGLDTDSIASGTTEVAADNESSTDRQQSDTAAQDMSPPALKKKTSTVTLVKEDVEPVRLLLQQLGELHDTLQKERTVRWNEFLRKVRAERKREGDAIAAAAAAAANAATMATTGTAEPRFLRATAVMPETRIADGEIIGIAGLGNKGKLGRAKWNEFRTLILGGIPLVLRAKVWAECTGAASLRVPGAYEDLVAAVARSSRARSGHALGTSSDKADAESASNQAAETEADVAAQVEADIYRTLTDNIFFREGPGTAKLKEVLLAYAQRNPEVGYCQGMNLIAANLLLVTPSAEDAFWLLASIIETILPAGYYDHSLAASRADQQVLRRYVAEVLPRLSAHFDALAIDLETMTFQWFLSVFTDCLSAEALFRVWDVVFCLGDGSVFLFQVALALLKLNEAALLRCTTPAAVYTYINHQMTNHAISIDGLIQASEALRKLVRREDVEARRAAALDADRALVAARAAAVAEAKASRKQKAEKAAAAQAAAVKVV